MKIRIRNVQTDVFVIEKFNRPHFMRWFRRPKWYPAVVDKITQNPFKFTSAESARRYWAEINVKQEPFVPKTVDEWEELLP